MASRPKHIRRIVLVAVSAIFILPLLMSLVALYGPVIWVSAALLTVATVALVWWRHRREAARERAYVGSPYGAVVVRMQAREAAQALEIEKRRSELLGAR
jgi:uncharacterized membrane protein YhhN